MYVLIPSTSLNETIIPNTSLIYFCNCKRLTWFLCSSVKPHEVLFQCSGEWRGNVTRGGVAAVLILGNLLLSWYRLPSGDIAIVQGWVCLAGFRHLFREVKLFGWRFSSSNVYYEGNINQVRYRGWHGSDQHRQKKSWEKCKERITQVRHLGWTFREI